jgi:hypothetical protein
LNLELNRLGDEASEVEHGEFLAAALLWPVPE